MSPIADAQNVIPDAAAMSEWAKLGFAALGATAHECLRLYKSADPVVEFKNGRFWIVLILAVIIAVAVALPSSLTGPWQAFLYGAGAPALLGRLVSEKERPSSAPVNSDEAPFRRQSGSRKSLLKEVRLWLAK